MRLLIVTQAVDTEDPALGFFVRWIEEFAKCCEVVTVICLRKGINSLPANVRVHSLGKESGVSRVKYVLNFYKYIWKLRREYDTVFVHMNPEYVVLGGWLWRMLGKRIGLWYTHRNADLKLRIASLCTDAIFTASPEGFRLSSRKIHAIGHGIDAGHFKNPNIVGASFRRPLRLLSVGRITPIKRLERAIESVALLRERRISAQLTFIGAPTQSGDDAYETELHVLVSRLGLQKEIMFAGTVSYAHIQEQYWHSDISINLCPTGGLDKAVLESMAAGVPVMVSNEGFRDLFGAYAERLIIKDADAHALALGIEALLHVTDVPVLRERLASAVYHRAGLSTLVESIVRHLHAKTG